MALFLPPLSRQHVSGLRQQWDKVVLFESSVGTSFRPPRCACVSAQGATQQHFRSCRANAAPARAQLPAPCEINLSISAPSSVRLMRSTVLNAITASPEQINSASSRACPSSRACQRSSAGGAGLPTASPLRPDRPSVTLPKMSGCRFATISKAISWRFNGILAGNPTKPIRWTDFWSMPCGLSSMSPLHATKVQGREQDSNPNCADWAWYACWYSYFCTVRNRCTPKWLRSFFDAGQASCGHWKYKRIFAVIPVRSHWNRTRRWSESKSGLRRCVDDARRLRKTGEKPSWRSKRFLDRAEGHHHRLDYLLFKKQLQANMKRLFWSLSLQDRIGFGRTLGVRSLDAGRKRAWANTLTLRSETRTTRPHRNADGRRWQIGAYRYWARLPFRGNICSTVLLGEYSSRRSTKSVSMPRMSSLIAPRSSRHQPQRAFRSAPIL